ncbi:hypothetical protein ACXYMU_16340 [Pontibacter sp. CAU 1760]
MKLLYSIVLLFVSSSAFAQYTVKALYDEHRKNSLDFEEKYMNKRLVITGKIHSVSPATYYIEGYNGNFHNVYLTATGYEIFIKCDIPWEEKDKLRNLEKGQEIVVTGVFSSRMRDGMTLTGCEFAQPSATLAKASPKNAKAPLNIPIGKYNVYQTGGGGFSFQYAFQLNSYTSYTMQGKNGSCSYDSKTKVIRFASGPLKGFIGKYRPVNPRNEKDPPTIVIGFNGVVPDLSKGYGGTYQYAYFKPGEKL